MFIIESYPVAVIFCVVTMLCWGSWANTQKLASSSWRFELFYWDYVFGIVISSFLFALSLGSYGEGGRSFLDDLAQGSSDNLLSALVGGVLFNAANILLVAAIGIAGMSVAFPIGIGLALVIGVVVNYIASPVGNSAFIFSGVGLIVCAIILNAYAYRKVSVGQAVTTKGILLSLLAGVLMGFFYQYVAKSMFPDFTVPESGKLSPYSAVFVFSIGILVSNVVFNTLIMRKPFQGEPVSYADYFHGSFQTHATGIAGGAIWCTGMLFSILASDQAGTAISYGLGQGATVIAALWGIFVWKEFKKSGENVTGILILMLGLYILGLTFIILAR